MRQQEKETVKQMEEILTQGIDQPDLWVNLFSSSVEKELSTYSKS